MNNGIVITKANLELILGAILFGKNKQGVAEWLADVLDNWVK